MAYAPSSKLDSLIGQFKENSEGHVFEYGKRPLAEMMSFAPHLPHVVYVGPTGSETRPAWVRKTVAHVAVDEDSDGFAIVQKWLIRSHRIYPGRS